MVLRIVKRNLKNKKRHKFLIYAFAEGEGFEPPVPFGTTVFKTAAFDRSAIPLRCF